MDLESLRLALADPSLAGLVLGFTAGFLFSFNPVAIAAIPVTVAYVTKAHEARRALWYGTAFMLGLFATHVTLGVAAAMGGEWVSSVIGWWWGLVLGPILIVLGLLWPGWIKFRIPWFSLRARPATGFWGAFALAIPFSVAICPVCTPALFVTLMAAAGVGSIPFGAALLFAFALGRAVPMLLGAAAVGWLESLKVLTRWQKGFEITAALVLILSGAYLIKETINLV